MAFNLGKKPQNTNPQPAPQQAKKHSFIKRGADAVAAMEQEAQKEAARKVGTSYFRFFLEPGTTRQITFLDGDLTSEGILDVPYWYEHNTKLNGKWFNYFVCLQDEEPCPICESGTYYASYVAGMTVLDHTPYTDKKGVVHEVSRKLFVAKRETIARLQLIAVKRGGLTGCTFDVTRTNDKAAAVGDMFDFTEKHDLNAIADAVGELATPVDYEEYLETIYKSAADLRKLGFGSSKPPIGSESYTSSANYEDDL